MCNEADGLESNLVGVLSGTAAAVVIATIVVVIVAVIIVLRSAHHCFTFCVLSSGMLTRPEVPRPRPRPRPQTCKAKAENAKVNFRTNATVNPVFLILSYFCYSLDKLQQHYNDDDGAQVLGN